MATLKTYLYLIWFPFAALLAAGAVPLVFSSTPTGAAHYPLILGLVVTAIAIWFKRGRVAQLAATLAIFAYWLLAALPDAKPTSGYDGQVIFALVALAVPLNVLLIAFLPNRVWRSRSGLARIAVIALQALSIYIFGNEQIDILTPEMAKLFDRALIDLLHFRLLPRSIDYWTFLPQPALIMTTAALVVLLLRLMVTAAAEDAGFLLALLAFALALHRIDNSLAAFGFHLAVQIIFIGALVHEAYRMAFIDELTEIANRRALDSLLGGLGGRYAIAMLGIDHFKKFNDTYGHAIGDQVLKMVAACVAQTGGGGRAFRYGGEEFTLVFPGKAADSIRPALEKLRREVEDTKFSLRGEDRPAKKPKLPRQPGARKKPMETVSVTLSIGLAEPDARNPRAQEVIRAADKALYKAKKAGRNRLVG